MAAADAYMYDFDERWRRSGVGCQPWAAARDLVLLHGHCGQGVAVDAV